MRLQEIDAQERLSSLLPMCCFFHLPGLRGRDPKASPGQCLVLESASAPLVGSPWTFGVGVLVV